MKACRRRRWATATLGRDGVEPDFTGADIAISRTQPRFDDLQQAREVEQLFFDMIDAAEHTIYIENQFLTALPIANRLADRLRARPELELLIVSPQTHVSWLEAQSMRAGRARFSAVLEGFGDRVWLAYPQVSDGENCATIMVHSKVMTVDDRILRVGSANLNNRSMGTDTECDLVITAEDEAQRAKIVELRSRLIGGSLWRHDGRGDCRVRRRTTARWSRSAREPGRNGHGLRNRLSISRRLRLRPSCLSPASPIRSGRSAPRNHPSATCLEVSCRRAISPPSPKVVVTGSVIVTLALIWQFVPLANPDEVRGLMASLNNNPLAPAIVVAVFVVAGLLMFPVTVLIAASAAAFGPWLGFSYAAVGALLSALATYAVGAALGKQHLARSSRPAAQSCAPACRQARHRRGGGDPAGAGRALYRGQSCRRRQLDPGARLHAPEP